MIRSTVPPGTVEDVTAILQAAFQDSGPDVGVAMCPEFLREGTGIADFYSPPYTVIGSSDLRAIDVRIAPLLLPRMPASSGTPAHRRSPQVRVQCLPRHQDLVRQRTWTDLRSSWRRQPRGHGALLRGQLSQHLAQVLAAGFRLRRIMPSKGPSLPPLSGTEREHRHTVALRRIGEQPVVDRRSHRPSRCRRGPSGRLAGSELQAR